MRSIPVLIGLSLLAACSGDHDAPADAIDIAYETFELDNGLRVLLHVDRSAPTVSVQMTTHVGSAREEPGRTGFAHLFEHLLFLESENLGRGGLDRLSERVGGSGANGSTDRDDTRYDQTVPGDALEKLLWAEADRLGYFINTVTEPVLAKEKQVVKNEKRQRYDNRAYGHKEYILTRQLYPHGHPYSWPVIGSLEDLEAAGLEDVRDFYKRWYVPNNVVLAVAGDFDVAQAKAWIHKYFDDIERGADVAKLEADPVVLDRSSRLVYEDAFANLPELTLAWPAPPRYHEDSYALSVLMNYLGRGKEAPLYANVVDGRRVSPAVSAAYRSWELAGEITITAQPFAGKTLDEVLAAIEEALGRFEEEGMPEAALQRLNTRNELRFYDLLLSAGAKANFLTQYAMFKGDAGWYRTDMERRRAVTTDDVVRVYETYIKDRPRVALSMVAEGDAEDALYGSAPVEVPTERIVAGAEEDIVIPDVSNYERSRSSFDRSVEPPLGETPTPRVPDVWEARLDNGLALLGVERHEVPLVKFQLIIDGGMWFDAPDKVGTANLLAGLMMKGTRNRTTAELEDAIRDLGSSIRVRAGRGSLQITGSTLARNYAATMELVSEILLEPRFDAREFASTRDRTLSSLQSWATMPSFITRETFRRLTVGEGHHLAQNSVGSIESLARISLDDLRRYHAEYIRPQLSHLNVVGAVSKATVLESVATLGRQWRANDVALPAFRTRGIDPQPVVYFQDIPGAKQSSIRVGQVGVSDRHPDFDKLRVVNYKLGGAGFMSLLMQQLRDRHGYTYSAGSGFRGNRHYGGFVLSTDVRANVTAQSLGIVRDILDAYPDDLTADVLRDTREAMLRGSLLQTGGLSGLLYHLGKMSEFDLPADFRQRELAMIDALTIDEVRELAQTYIDTRHMYYLVAGDAATQLERVRALNLGRLVLVGED